MGEIAQLVQKKGHLGLLNGNGGILQIHILLQRLADEEAKLGLGEDFLPGGVAEGQRIGRLHGGIGIDGVAIDSLCHVGNALRIALIVAKESATAQERAACQQEIQGCMFHKRMLGFG